MVKLDQGLIDRARIYVANVRTKKNKENQERAKKNKPLIPAETIEDYVVIGLVERFHPSRPEYTEVQFPLYPSRKGTYKDYTKRMMTNQQLRLFNKINKYRQQIIGIKATYTDLYGKVRYTALLAFADNETAGPSAEWHEKPRDGYNDKIDRLREIEGDKTVKARAKKLLKEIER